MFDSKFDSPELVAHHMQACHTLPSVVVPDLRHDPCQEPGKCVTLDGSGNARCVLPIGQAGSPVSLPASCATHLSIIIALGALLMAAEIWHAACRRKFAGCPDTLTKMGRPEDAAVFNLVEPKLGLHDTCDFR